MDVASSIDRFTNTLIGINLIRVRVDLRFIFFALDLISRLDCGGLDLRFRSRRKLS